jgi:rubrerythrin
MPNRNNTGAEELQFLSRLAQATNRRTFLKWSGVTIAVTAVGCSDDRLLQPVGPEGRASFDHLTPQDSVTLNFANDFGVLNYAYALEQLEADFYIQVINRAQSGMLSLSDEAFEVLDDLRKHEIVHRDFFAAALGSNGIGTLKFAFPESVFRTQNRVLSTARTFEDLGVGAYNGAAQMLNNPNFLLVAGKIVSVEARHAAAIRDLISSTSFAPNAFDPAFAPSTVLSQADPFIVSEVNVQNLPGDLVTFEGRNP